MKIINRELFIPLKNLKGLDEIKKYYISTIQPNIPNGFPIRFVVVETTDKNCRCEIDFVILENDDPFFFESSKTIFDFCKRSSENTDKFITALIIPTGIGAEVGGHCGDGNATARLLASACDTLITHPNVVNASDINEMTENTLYVEGSILTRLFMGTIGLQRVRSNKILMIMDKSKDIFFNDEIVNAVSSARVTIGIDCDVLEIGHMMKSQPIFTKSGRASGNINHFEKLLEIIEKYRHTYDAIGLATIVNLPGSVDEDYFKNDDDVVNPWGGIEAMITHTVASAYNLPCAHSPLSGSLNKLHLNMNLGVVDPRKAPETASVSYLHCILKGLHKSPRITSYEKGLNVEDISCLVVPDGCIGLPVLACIEHEIPVIAVRNKNKMKNDLRLLPFKDGKIFFADNFLEVVGIMTAIKAGVSTKSVLRPIKRTKVLKR